MWGDEEEEEGGRVWETKEQRPPSVHAPLFSSWVIHLLAGFTSFSVGGPQGRPSDLSSIRLAVCWKDSPLYPFICSKQAQCLPLLHSYWVMRALYYIKRLHTPVFIQVLQYASIMWLITRSMFTARSSGRPCILNEAAKTFSHLALELWKGFRCLQRPCYMPLIHFFFLYNFFGAFPQIV